MSGPFQPPVDVQPKGLPKVHPLALVAAFFALSLGWVVAVQVILGVLVVGLFVMGGGTLDQLAAPDALTSVLTPGLLGAGSILQALGIAAIAIGLAMLAAAPLREVLGFSRARVAAFAVAGLGGLTVGMFPGWVAYQLAEHLPWLDWGNLEMLNQALLGASLGGKLVLIAAICLFAPLLEEVVFRGFVWDQLSRVIPTWGVWLFTSAAFAAYHIDPVHVIAVFFTGLFLGWVRWVGGSLWPCVVAHFVNNALATVVAFAVPAEYGDAPGWAWALGSVVVTTGLGAVGWLTRARREA